MEHTRTETTPKPLVTHIVTFTEAEAREVIGELFTVLRPQPYRDGREPPDPNLPHLSELRQLLGLRNMER